MLKTILRVIGIL